MKEGDIVKAILDAYAGHPRIRLWRQNTGVARVRGSHVRFGVPGAGDITGIILDGGGRRIEIECKQPKAKQRAAQVEFADMIRRHGGLYILAYSVDDVKAILNERY